MRAVGSLLVLLVINAVLSSEFYVSAEGCDPSQCTNSYCLISNNTCNCVPGYSGVNCSIAACDREDACPENEDCVMNPIFVGGYYCIPRACSALNCATNETCGRLSNADNYTCLGNPCVSDSNCNSTNGVCTYFPQSNNFSCDCNPGYAQSSRCNIALPCDQNNQEQQCRNGGTCMGGVSGDFHTCNCIGGYTGLRCETDICHSLYPCVSGSCSVITSPPYYKCSCEKGYMGYNCSKLSGPCDFNGTCLNNGTCMADDNDVGGYKCLCTDDWDPATNCSTKIDHCRSNPCEHGGTCVRNNSSHYTCDCEKGYYGRNCTFNNPCECENGGICRANTTCECPDEYIGPKCGIYDHCANSNCNEATERCVNREKNFECKCKSGYAGVGCSLDQCTCSGRGICRRNDTSHWCDCYNDYTGDECQYRLCTATSCYNSGNCTDGDMEHFSCSCPKWATGTQCESLVNLVLPGFTVPNITDCPPDCAQKRKNGECDAKCNVGVCDFDGGDCKKICDDVTSENISCQDVFKNGICNPECNSLECLQDGIDCRQNLPFCPDRFCGDVFGNGKCNQTCNNAECQFDGGDCEEEGENRKILEGLLFIVIRATPEDFNRNKNRFLFEIAEALNCIPIFVGVEDVTGRLSKRQDSKNSSLEVDLQLDVTQCNNETDTCVGSVENASNIIGNLSQNRGFRPSGYDILETGTKIDPTTTPPPQPTPFPLESIIGIAMVVLIISAVVLTAGIVIKRKRKAVIWRPEGPNNTPRSNSYEEDLPTAKRYVPGKERSSKDLHSETDDYPMKPMGEKEEWVDVPGEMTTNCSGTFVVGQVQRDPPSWSALHYKALRQPSMVHELVTKFNEETDISIDVNIRGPGGYTSLMVAVMLGNVQREGEDESDYECTRPSLINGSEAASPPRSLTVKDLLRMKADPNLKNDLGQTALHIAAACSRADVTRLLLSNRADPNAQDCNGRSPLHIAVTSEAEGVFQLLLRHKNTNPDLDAEDGTTPLILATQHHSVSMVEQLLKEAHVDANTQDKGGKTALHWAASMNMTDIMKILLKQGANKDSQDNNGQTPLFLAAKEGSSDAVRLLLESLANRNIQDNMERTPLRIAESRFHKDIVHLLTEAYYNHVSEQPSQQPDVRIQGPTCHGYSRPEVYEYLSEATTVPPPPYQTQYPGTSMHESHVTTAHNGYQSRQPDGAEDIQPSIKSSPHSIHSGVVVTPSGLPTACSLEPHMDTSMYNTSNATTQYLRDTVGTMDLTTTTDALLQPMISPMSGYSPPYTGDPLQTSHDQASFGMTTIPTSPGGIIVNPTADINTMYYPSPPESNKSPCSYDSGAQIPTPPESYNSDGQIESPPSCMRLGPTVGFPACQGMYHGHQHPPLQQR